MRRSSRPQKNDPAARHGEIDDEGMSTARQPVAVGLTTTRNTRDGLRARSKQGCRRWHTGLFFAADDRCPDVYTITGIQLESMEEFGGFHGVNERILVEEYGRSIAFFYQLMNNLEDL